MATIEQALMLRGTEYSKWAVETKRLIYVLFHESSSDFDLKTERGCKELKTFMDETKVTILKNVNLAIGFESYYSYHYSYLLRYKLEVAEYYGCKYEEASQLAFIDFLDEEVADTYFSTTQSNLISNSLMIKFDTWYRFNLRTRDDFVCFDEEVKKIIRDQIDNKA